MKIRRALIDDVAQIVDLSIDARAFHNEFLGDYFDTQDPEFEGNFIENAIEDDKLDVFVCDDEVIKGFVLVSYSEKKWLKRSSICTVENIAVGKNYRRQGIGKEMLSFVYENAKQKGIEAISLGVFCKNTNAIPFYEDFGFKPLSIKMNMEVE